MNHLKAKSPAWWTIKLRNIPKMVDFSTRLMAVLPYLFSIGYRIALFEGFKQALRLVFVSKHFLFVESIGFQVFNQTYILFIWLIFFVEKFNYFSKLGSERCRDREAPKRHVGLAQALPTYFIFLRSFRFLHVAHPLIYWNHCVFLQKHTTVPPTPKILLNA